jgi:lipoate-protein ligase A
LKWREILDGKANAALNMGTDEAILDAVAVGSSPPTLRLYTWSPSAVSIGRFQAYREVVDLEACRMRGVDLVRRITGGGSVYHGEGGEVTYSIVLEEKRLPGGDYVASFEYLLGGVIGTLRTLGLKADFARINDVVVNGRKISGSAQVRRNGAVLQHGTVLLEMDKEAAFGVLSVPKLKVVEKGLSEPGDRVTSIVAEGVRIDVPRLYRELEDGFSNALGADMAEGRLSEEESKAALMYSERRYSDPSWLESR